jgi:hypothetical protein
VAVTRADPALACIVLVLSDQAERNRTKFDPLLCRRELLRHLHLNPNTRSREYDTLQQQVDECILGLLRDARYNITYDYKTDKRSVGSLLVIARSGNNQERKWVAHQLELLADTADRWSSYEVRCAFDALAALLGGQDDVINEKVANVYEILLANEDKQKYFLVSGSILLLVGIIMSTRPRTQTAGFKAIRVLISTKSSLAAALECRLPIAIAAFLDVWYTTYLWELRDGIDYKAIKDSNASPNAIQTQHAVPNLVYKPNSPTFPQLENRSPARETAGASEQTSEGAQVVAVKPFNPALKNRFKHAASKMAVLSVINKDIKVKTAEERAASIEGACAALEMLLSDKQSDCGRDFVQSGVGAALCRATLLPTTAPHKPPSGHCARRVLAVVQRATLWSVGSVNFDGEYDDYYLKVAR